VGFDIEINTVALNFDRAAHLPIVKMSVNLPVFVLQSYAYAHSTTQQLPCQSVTPSIEREKTPDSPH
jgi:hypothetical protein